VNVRSTLTYGWNASRRAAVIFGRPQRRLRAVGKLLACTKRELGLDEEIFEPEVF
jgi:hypothetical protein